MFPQGQKNRKDEADAESLYCSCLLSEDHVDEGWVRCQKCVKGHTLFVRPIGKGPLYVAGARNDR